MTDRATQPLLFSRLSRKKIQADFDGGPLTTDAGLLPLREFDHRIGLIEAMDAAIADPRDPIRIRHQQRTLLTQRIYGIAAGYEDLNDQQTLRHDPVFSILAERAPDPDAPLASPPTLSRLENRLKARTSGGSPGFSSSGSSPRTAHRQRS